jgi:hypothetical protein
MDFSHDRMVIDHSIAVSIAKFSMLNFAIDTPISWSIPTIYFVWTEFKSDVVDFLHKLQVTWYDSLSMHAQRYIISSFECHLIEH